MTGEPKMVSSLTTASMDDVLAVTLSPVTANVGEIMTRMLTAFEEPAILYYCASLNTIVGTTDGATIDLIQLMFNGDSGPTLTLTPLDTFGASRRFAIVEDLLDSVLAVQLANDFQRRTLAGLVNLANSIRFKANQPGLDVLVSQFNSHVVFKQSDGSSANILPNLPPSGQTIGIKITEKQTRYKSIFE